MNGPTFKNDRVIGATFVVRDLRPLMDSTVRLNLINHGKEAALASDAAKGCKPTPTVVQVTIDYGQAINLVYDAWWWQGNWHDHINNIAKIVQSQDAPLSAARGPSQPDFCAIPNEGAEAIMPDLDQLQHEQNPLKREAIQSKIQAKLRDINSGFSSLFDTNGQFSFNGYTAHVLQVTGATGNIWLTATLACPNDPINIGVHFANAMVPDPKDSNFSQYKNVLSDLSTNDLLRLDGTVFKSNDTLNYFVGQKPPLITVQVRVTDLKK